MLKICREFLDGLTDIQFLSFVLHYGINHKGVYLTVLEISRMLDTTPSTVYGALDSAHNRLRLSQFQPILEALQTRETSDI